MRVWKQSSATTTRVASPYRESTHTHVLCVSVWVCVLVRSRVSVVLDVRALENESRRKVCVLLQNECWLPRVVNRWGKPCCAVWGLRVQNEKCELVFMARAWAARRGDTPRGRSRNGRRRKRRALLRRSSRAYRSTPWRVPVLGELIGPMSNVNPVLTACSPPQLCIGCAGRGAGLSCACIL